MNATGPLHVESHGAGRPILLLHGLGATTYTWRHLVPSLARRHHVIAVDLKGFGRSPKPRDHRYSVRDHARCVGDLIAERDLTDLTLVGHSFGGGVALVLALGAAAGARLRRLVLIDGMAYRQHLPWFIALLRLPVAGPAALALAPKRALVRLVLRQSYHDPSRVTDDAVEAYAAALRCADARRAVLDTAAALPPPDADELARAYGSIAVPTLLVWGRQDPIVPLAVGERLRRAIAGSTLAVIDGAGHLPQEEAPEAVLDQLCPFLDRSAEGDRAHA